MILVTGAKGQLGHDVVRALKQRGVEHLGIDIQDLDITDGEAVRRFIREQRPAGVIHCAAYTAVDRAEDEPTQCFRANEEGTAHLAEACREVDAEMLYISTDYVFDGTKGAPYEIDDRPNPLQVYGRSKLAGEDAVKRHLDKYYIVRISWVFGSNGNNFVKTILRLAETKAEINVVCDQIGSPTYTADLSVLLCDMVLSGRYGVYHATNEGYCSWADFAEAIIQAGGLHCKVNRIMSEDWPAKAARPRDNRLSKERMTAFWGHGMDTWQGAVSRYLGGVTHGKI